MNEEQGGSDRWLTLPNVITAIRIIGSPCLIPLAMIDQPLWLAGWVAFLVFTEWVDGFLARRLKVTSATGARLDTLADLVFYSCLLLSLVLLRPVLIGQQWLWIVVAVLSYVVSWLASLIKFGGLPSYHTWAAKGSWVVVGIGTICLLTEIAAWPFQLAMVCVTLTNLEATCITLVIHESRVDIPTLRHALGLRAHAPKMESAISEVPDDSTERES